MNKHIFKIALGITLMAVPAATFCWDLWVYNQSDAQVDVHLNWAGIFCSNDSFYLNPGGRKMIHAGGCDMTRAELWGAGGAILAYLDVTKATGNPVQGIKIIKTAAGKLKIVRAEDSNQY